MLSEPQVQRFWSQLCKAMGIPELENDPKFNTIQGQRDNCIELISIIKRTIATRTCNEWEDILGRQVGISCSPVFSMEDLANDPQILENKYIVEFDHPVLGRIKAPGFPVGLSETPPSIRMAPPQFGQNTEEILLEIGGYNWDEIMQLRELEVI
jgi:CoA:oxalate CoA-transferase